MAVPANVTGETFENEVINSQTPVLVDFWAPWCGPCRMMAPVLDELANEFEGKLKIAKLDTEVPQNRDIAMKYRVMSIPNLKLFKNGRVVREFVGFRPKEILKSELEAEL